MHDLFIEIGSLWQNDNIIRVSEKLKMIIYIKIDTNFFNS